VIGWILPDQCPRIGNPVPVTQIRDRQTRSKTEIMGPRPSRTIIHRIPLRQELGLRGDVPPGVTASHQGTSTSAIVNRHWWQIQSHSGTPFRRS